MPGQVVRDRDGEFSFKVVHHLGVYGRSAKGWTKEANVIEWNGNRAKLDLREWDPEHTRMSRGITLHKQEMLYLLQILLKNYGKELREIQRAREEWLPQPEEPAGEGFSGQPAAADDFGADIDAVTRPAAISEAAVGQETASMSETAVGQEPAAAPESACMQELTAAETGTDGSPECDAAEDLFSQEEI